MTRVVQWVGTMGSRSVASTVSSKVELTDYSRVASMVYSRADWRAETLVYQKAGTMEERTVDTRVLSSAELSVALMAASWAV